MITWLKKNKIMLAVCLIVLVSACILAWKWHVPDVPQTTTTDLQVEILKQELQMARQEMESLKKQFRKEVQAIHATIQQEVNTMSVSGVADALNDELSKFRELSSSSEGMGDSGTGVLD